MSQKKYPERARRYVALSHTGTCANCTNHGVLKYARRTMCTRYKCQKAATAEREKRLADGGGDDAVVPTYCFEIKEVIGMRFADPERLVGKKRRNELAAAETSLCYLTRGKFGEDQNDDGFIDTRWGNPRAVSGQPPRRLGVAVCVRGVGVPCVVLFWQVEQAGTRAISGAPLHDDATTHSPTRESPPGGPGAVPVASRRIQNTVLHDADARVALR